MNGRVKMLLISLGCLCLGTVIYLLSRPDTYISVLIFKILHIEKTQVVLSPFVSYYIPDYLWAASLCSGLFALLPLKRGLVWGIVVFLYGALWEFLQLCCIVSGTADMIDVILYLSAGLTVVMINYYLKMREEK